MLRFHYFPQKRNLPFDLSVHKKKRDWPMLYVDRDGGRPENLGGRVSRYLQTGISCAHIIQTTTTT